MMMSIKSLNDSMHYPFQAKLPRLYAYLALECPDGRTFRRNSRGLCFWIKPFFYSLNVLDEKGVTSKSSLIT